MCCGTFAMQEFLQRYKDSVALTSCDVEKTSYGWVSHPPSYYQQVGECVNAMGLLHSGPGWAHLATGTGHCKWTQRRSETSLYVMIKHFHPQSMRGHWGVWWCWVICWGLHCHLITTPLNINTSDSTHSTIKHQIKEHLLENGFHPSHRVQRLAEWKISTLEVIAGLLGL